MKINVEKCFFNITDEYNHVKHLMVLTALLSRSFVSNVMVFCQTKKQAHRLHIVLGLLKPPIRVSAVKIFSISINGFKKNPN